MYTKRPPPEADIFRTLPNILGTPHIGFNTKEAGSNMLRIARLTVEAYLRGEQLHVVNVSPRPVR